MKALPPPALALAAALAAALALGPASARAHGPNPAVLGVLAADPAGEPARVRLTVGLGLRDEAGAWRLACPSRWGGPERPLAADAGPAGTWIVASAGHVLLNPAGGARPAAGEQPDPLAVVALAAGPAGLHALAGFSGPRTLWRLDPAGSEALLRADGPWTSLAAGADALWLAGVEGGAVRLTLVAPSGEVLADGPLDLPPPAAAHASLRPGPGAPLLLVRAGDETRLLALDPGPRTPAAAVELGRLPGAVLGPVAVGEALLAAADGALYRLDPGGVAPVAPGGPRITCLDGGPGRAWACSQASLHALGPDGPGAVAFALDRLGPTDPTGLDEGAASACLAEWADLAFHAGLDPAGPPPPEDPGVSSPGGCSGASGRAPGAPCGLLVLLLFLRPRPRRPCMRGRLARLALPAGLAALVALGACAGDAGSPGAAGSPDASGADAPAEDGAGGDSSPAPPDAVATPDAPPPDGADPPAATWHGGARAVLEARCASCHRAGGVAPFALDTYEAARVYAPAGLLAIQDGRMPPWPPSDACLDYVGERHVAPEEEAVLAAWIAAGLPEGDPADYVPPAVPPDPLDALGPPDLSLTPGAAYTPNAALLDDYHCFVLDDPAFADDTFVRMVNVRPGNADTVHHVIVFQVPPESADAARARDAATPEPGYTCFGGAGVDGAGLLGGWVPGSVPYRYQDGDALLVPAGGLLVMQVHYNTLSVDTPDPGTAVDLWLSDAAPSSLVAFVPLANGGIDIAPGDPSSHHAKVFPNPTGLPVPLIGVLPHMHLLGRAISVTVLEGGEGERCLVDIPRWDFGWQQQYYFTEPVTLGPFDKLRLDCTYDNSPANQPVINGVQGEPQRVRWGEGTLDEMCLAYVILRVPYVGADGGCGAPYEACYHGCRDGGSGMSFCAVSCVLEQPDCTECAASALGECLDPVCPDELGDLVGCVQGCLQKGGNVAACAFLQCSPAGDALDACAQDDVDGGLCDDAFAACEVSLSRD